VNGYIFFLSKTWRKVFSQHSNNPIVSWVLFPNLSGLPAIFQDFFAVLTSFPHLGHFAMFSIPPVIGIVWRVHKTFSIPNVKKSPKQAKML
jgi:hypothetical protein